MPLPSTAETDRASTPAGAIVILGCRTVRSGDGALTGALGRRVRLGAARHSSAPDNLIVASGGRVWDGEVEADAMGAELVRLGVPAARVLRERCSHTTRENALYTSRLLARLGIAEVLVVTCDWHVDRARDHFERRGMRVQTAGASDPGARASSRVWSWGREKVARVLDAMRARRAGA